jgi:putative redox protein
VSIVEPVTFTGAAGAPLSGMLHLPGDDPVGSVLLAHCFTCSKDLHTMTRLANSLCEAGYAVLRFDFTGLGDSGGEFSATTVATNVSDLARAAMTLIERGYGPFALVGHSLGGSAGLLAAHRLKTVRSVVVIGAPASPSHVRGLLTGEEAEIRASGVATVTIEGRPFPVSAEFLDDLARHDEAASVADLARPLLVIHALDDEVVPISEGERIFAVARQPKGFVPVVGADHLLVDRDAAAWVARVIVAWLDATR